MRKLFVLLVSAFALFTAQQVVAQTPSTKPENVANWAADKEGETPYTELKEATAKIAQERQIPLIQVAYRSPERYFAFEYSTREDVVADPNVQTTFQACSISKVVFSYIVLRLVDRGLLDLDKPLYKYYGKRGQVDPRFCNAFETRAENKENIRRAKLLTARIVLNHRTGLPNWAKKTPGTKKEERPLIFKCEPGEKHTYSGEGIWYLQRTIEHITGKSLEQLAREEVFEPFGMVSSSYVWLPRYKKQGAYGYNKNHEKRGRGVFKSPNAAYTLTTNVLDFSRFLEKMMVGEGLKPKTFKEWTSSLMPAPREATSFGLGVRVSNKGAGRDEVWHHSGSNPNFRCRFMLFPERKSYLVWYTNSVYGAKIHKMMRSIYYPDYEGDNF